MAVKYRKFGGLGDFLLELSGSIGYKLIIAGYLSCQWRIWVWGVCLVEEVKCPIKSKKNFVDEW